MIYLYFYFGNVTLGTINVLNPRLNSIIKGFFAGGRISCSLLIVEHKPGTSTRPVFLIELQLSTENYKLKKIKFK